MEKMEPSSLRTHSGNHTARDGWTKCTNSACSGLKNREQRRQVIQIQDGDYSERIGGNAAKAAARFLASSIFCCSSICLSFNFPSLSSSSAWPRSRSSSAM
eukprot:TRINITY_DN12183_c0_g1_i3.p2 TRINITY_DN12183_c0_g1~~TRINITY_DN12183_c0_g1_i3.p2  ORF type:complete len:101 (+),score=10.01 TRINITY_DN12183_c0_g1_i3:340-642(+)